MHYLFSYLLLVKEDRMKLFLIIISLALLVPWVPLLPFEVEELPKFEDWDPVKEDIDPRRAEEESRKAEKRRKNAEEEAKRYAEDPAKVRKSNIEQAEALWDKSTADIVFNQDVIKNIDDPIKVRQAIENKQIAVKNQRTAYEQLLNYALESPKLSDYTVSNDSATKTYQDRVEASLKKAVNDPEKLSILKKEFYAAQKGSMPYDKQRDLLTILKQEASTLQSSDVDNFLKSIDKRVVEIAQFKPSEHLSGNKIDADLKLYEKIPTDRLTTVKSAFTSAAFDRTYKTEESRVTALNQLKQILTAYDITETGLRNQFDKLVDTLTLTNRLRLRLNGEKPEKQVTILKEEFDSLVGKKSFDDLKYIQQAMHDYKLSNIAEGFATELDTIIKNYEVPQESSLPSNVTQQDLDIFTGSEGGLIDTSGIQDALMENGKVVVDTATNLLGWGIDKLTQGTTYLLEKEGKFLESTLPSVEKFGKGLQQAPELLKNTLGTIETLENSSAVKFYVEGNLKVLSWALGEENVNMIREVGTKAVGAAKDFLHNTVVEKITQASGSVGAVIVDVAEAGILLGKQQQLEAQQLQGKNVDTQMKALDRYQATQELIKAEKGKLDFSPERQDGTFASLKRAFLDFGTKIRTWVKDLKFQYKESTARSNYNAKRKQCFDALYLPDNPSAGQLKNALEANKENKKVIKAIQDFAQATADMVQIQQEYKNKLEGAKVNFEFVIKMWDALDINQQIAVTDMVQPLFELRQMKINQLQAAQNAINVLQDDISALMQGTSLQQLSEDFINGLNHIVAQDMFKTIGDFNTLMQAIDQSLETSSNALKQTTSPDSGNLDE